MRPAKANGGPINLDIIGLGLCGLMFALWAFSGLSGFFSAAGSGLGIADAQGSFAAATEYWASNSMQWIIALATKSL